MSSTPNIRLDDLWQYSLETYAKPNVSEMCLSLQNQCDINVNLLLLTSYLDTLGLFLDDSQWARLDQHILKINNSLKVLRQARTLIKELNSEVYDKLLLAELDLEKQTQQQLVDEVNVSGLAPREETNNLIRFLEFKGVSASIVLAQTLSSASSLKHSH